MSVFLAETSVLFPEILLAILFLGNWDNLFQATLLCSSAPWGKEMPTQMQLLAEFLWETAGPHTVISCL